MLLSRAPDGRHAALVRRPSGARPPGARPPGAGPAVASSSADAGGSLPGRGRVLGRLIVARRVGVSVGVGLPAAPLARSLHPVAGPAQREVRALLARRLLDEAGA